MIRPNAVRRGLALALFMVGVVASPGIASVGVSLPTIDSVDNSVPGKLTIQVTSPNAPYIRLTLAGTETIGTKLRSATDSVTVATGGYPSAITLTAVACSTQACSGSTAPMTVHPMDVVPDFDWPTDALYGPEQQATVTVNDDPGTGVLVVRTSPSATSGTPLAKQGASSVPVPAGNSTLTLVRCRSVAQTQCVGFTPAQNFTTLGVRSVIPQFIKPLPITQSKQTTTVTLTGTLDGRPFADGDTATIYWSLVTGSTTVQASGTVTSALSAASPTVGSFTINGVGLSDMSGSINVRVVVETAEFGTLEGYPIVGNNNVLTIDRKAPTSSNFRATPSVIYPWINNRSNPGSTQLSAFGGGTPRDFAGFSVFQGTKLIRSIATISESAKWNGRRADGTILPPGKYTVRMRDFVGNLGSQSVTVTISSRGR